MKAVNQNPKMMEINHFRINMKLMFKLLLILLLFVTYYCLLMISILMIYMKNGNLICIYFIILLGPFNSRKISWPKSNMFKIIFHINL
jgi:hypothetical protein